ncbi:MAG TPA: nucleotidyltransferase family protein [Kiloniellales bacterium]|jgi:MurNAc alpha-1-phosphate uridylyltransferase
MTKPIPQKAMILAAGLGERMRPVTNDLPKPLIPVAGQPLIDSILDRLNAAGVPDVVVNLHYLGEKLKHHLQARTRPRIAFSPESTRLETGGGVRRALPLLGADPFYVVNGDVCWLDGVVPALDRLAAAWRDETMDALLLLQPTATAFGYDGRGDFRLDPLGQARRRGEREVVPFVFAGVQILHPRLFAGTPEGAFSLNLVYDKAAAAGRLYGVRHDGEWFHIGTPQGLRDVEEALQTMAFSSPQK